MRPTPRPCPDCVSTPLASVHRRDFLRVAGAAGLAAATPGLLRAEPAQSAESLVDVLYGTLSDAQKKEICFAWDYQDAERGLLRTRISNNWQITQPSIGSEFYSKEQQDIIRQIFEGIIQPDWHARIDQQLEDDAGGYGREQSIAIFGQPGTNQFEFVMTGRHMTLRCDGNSAEHMAFGGPIFYGHAANGFNEEANHPGNVFWPQALAANELFQMLDGKQRELALVESRPAEQAVGFRGTAGGFPGIPVGELSSDQQENAQKILQLLLEPYRQSDQEEALACLQAQGGLTGCSLAFYKEGDIGNDGVWDCWRLEGPSFVWYFRGEPHVHVWVNISDSADIQTNA